MSSITLEDDEKMIFKNQFALSVSSGFSQCFIQSPLNLVDDEQSSIIVFKDNIK